ncbi:MAG: hypothetical protein AAGA75_16940 [Cyanobacteria bacterium P01_E01_bin.6]
MMNKSAEGANLSGDIEAALHAIDQGTPAPPWIEASPGKFLRQFYDIWHLNGGFESGKYYRNSLRIMQERWLVDENKIRSLYPKLSGKTRITPGDIRILVALFINKWRFVGAHYDGADRSEDGYIPYNSDNPDSLIDNIIDALLAKNKQGFYLEVKKQSDVHKDDMYSVLEIFVDDQYKNSRALIHYSRNRTVIGPDPQETLRAFWFLLYEYHKSDLEKDQDLNILIWLVDAGSRVFEESDAFKPYFNLTFLISCMLTFANFDTIEDDESGDVVNIYKSIKSIDKKKRQRRWQWLNEKAIFIVQNLRKEERECIINDKFEDLSEIELKSLGITSEHIFPQQIPDKWSSKLRAFYGKNMKNLDETTLSVAIPRELTSRIDTPGNVKYYAHNKLVPDPEGHEEEASVRTIELSTPGENYDQAMIMTYMAARCRQRNKRAVKLNDGELALAYLRKHGFEVITLPDLMKLFLLSQG